MIRAALLKDFRTKTVSTKCHYRTNSNSLGRKPVENVPQGSCAHSMPVYLFTYHAYRTWNADNSRGFVKWKEGVQEPDVELARAYDKHAKDPRVLFDESKQSALLWIIHDCCCRRQWRLHFVASESSHIHLLMSWRDRSQWKDVSTRVKDLASRALGQISGEQGRKWFVRRSSRKRVKNRKHFDYLVTNYLPSHRGLKWKEGDPPPNKPQEVCD